MNLKIFNFLEIAAKTATHRKDERSFLLGSIGIRSDGKLVKAFNSPSEFPDRTAHSEFRLSKKLDYGATVYVARVRLQDGQFGMSRPCFNCMKVLKSKKVKRIYYTISAGEFGIIDL